MIPLDFDYVPARTYREAVTQFRELAKAGMNPLYYAGGTEIITLARFHQVGAGAVIDIKPIPETRVIRLVGEQLILGAATTLTQLVEHPWLDREFPLLQATVQEIADRTARNKITLGGNICGQIIYREALLPLLLCDSQLRVAGVAGKRVVNVSRMAVGGSPLRPGDLIVQIVTDKEARKAPFVHLKRRKMGRVGYPVVTAAALRVNHAIRAAFSGVCSYPFRSRAIELELNREGVDWTQRVDNAIRLIPPREVLDDFEASRDYRMFVLRCAMLEILEKLGGR
ncbi:FAD binding domain-containing protein [Alicyclobacillus fastidiosus]|uniref:FAD binding domain-containing protein n=1 Tax=Alicyclobacillus fastidiosus TaxID=392011 RepID=A0ABY6ZFW1_9BACL|nr:FAD binding domain-containing protein [Alicyclobacillus fastidiosus]WAH41727.1 FAD binding domain-containing protein [Alicyclobacillus fastidiosus]GMA63414.1 xanthine dehydrogenase [Alicyclobacillus fastidiosus]